MEIFSVDLNSTHEEISQALEVKRSWSPWVCLISSRLLSSAVSKKKKDKNPWLAAGIAANVLGWIVQTDAPEAATVNGVLKSTGGLLSRDRRCHKLVFIKQDRDRPTDNPVTGWNLPRFYRWMTCFTSKKISLPVEIQCKTTLYISMWARGLKEAAGWCWEMSRMTQVLLFSLNDESIQHGTKEGIFFLRSFCCQPEVSGEVHHAASRITTIMIRCTDFTIHLK